MTGGGIFNDSILGEIHKKGLLKQVDPVLGAQLEDSWNDKYKRRELVQIKQIPVLPKLLKDLAKANNENPVFSFHSTAKLRLPKYKRFYFSIGAHDVDIYADGRVNLNFGYMDSRKENVETVLKLTPQQLQQFITDVKSLKMADWVNEPEFCADDWCGINVLQYFVLNRVNDDVKTFEMSLVTPKDITPTNLEGKYFSQITTLIEKYIPTQKLRCSIGTSKTYTQSCLDFYYQLAKTGE